MQGQVQEEQRNRHFWGWKLLLPLILISVVVSIITGFGTIAVQLSQLVYGLVVIVILLCIIGAALGVGARSITGGLGRAGGAVVRGAMSAARLGAQGAKGSMGLLSRPISPFALTLRRFRIVDLLGNTTSCVMEGEVYSDLVRQGDLVRVHGKPDRSGFVKVKQIDILNKIDLSPRSVVRPKKPAPYVAAQAVDMLCKAAAAGLLLYWLASLALGMG